jgi:hypothetical protein
MKTYAELRALVAELIRASSPGNGLVCPLWIDFADVMITLEGQHWATSNNTVPRFVAEYWLERAHEYYDNQPTTHEDNSCMFAI